jgi:hypothetical protein
MGFFGFVSLAILLIVLATWWFWGEGGLFNEAGLHWHHDGVFGAKSHSGCE